jgi:hypothetical protein
MAHQGDAWVGVVECAFGAWLSLRALKREGASGCGRTRASTRRIYPSGRLEYVAPLSPRIAMGRRGAGSPGRLG